MKNARKYIILAAALLLTATVHAQVFLMTDEDFHHSERVVHNPTTPLAPYQGGDSAKRKRGQKPACKKMG